jgi:hypothetical protein
MCIMRVNINNFQKKEVPICIVGSGPAGVSLSLQLAQRKIKHIVISSGSAKFDIEHQSLYKGENISNLPSVPLEESRLRMLGGTSNHWTGHVGEFDPRDINGRSGNNENYWSEMNFDDLQQYYEEAWSILGAKDRHERYINTGIEDELFHLRALYQYPLRFGTRFLNFFERSEYVTLVEDANLVGFHTKADHSRVTRVDVSSFSTHIKKSIDVGQVVLACGGVENARILLNSNLSSMLPALGRYYAFHPRLVSGRLYLSNSLGVDNIFQWNEFGETVRRPFITLGNEKKGSDFLPNHAAFLDNIYDEESPAFSSISRIKRWAKGGLPEIDLIKEIGTTINHSGDIFNRVFSRRGSTISELAIFTYIDPEPSFSNFVSLSSETDRFGLRRPIVQWSPTKRDIETTYQFNLKLAELFGRKNFGRIKLVDNLRDYNVFCEKVRQSSGGGHQMGTTRISVDRLSGVVDSNLRVHGVSNLYCAGSSVFPTFSWVNPTLTILALSLRLGDHLET